MIIVKSLLKDYRLFIFLIIFVSSETILFGTNNNATYISLKNLFVFLLFPLSFYLLHKEKKSIALPASMQGWVLCFALFLLCCSIANGFTPGYISRFLLILSGFNIARSIKRIVFWSTFEKIIFFIACYSICAYVVNFAIPQVMRVFPIIDNTADYSFYNLLFCNIPTNAIFATRLFGSFREPGVFQMFLIMGLMTHWLQSTTIRGLRVSVYIVAILLTLSTTGYIALTILIIIYRFSQTKNGLKDEALFVMLFLLLFVLYLYTDTLSSEGAVFGKLNDEDNISTISRFGSIMGNIHVFLSSPFFGVGILSLDGLYNSYIKSNYFYFTSSNTNTILIQFSTFGLFFGVLWSYGFCRFWGKLSSKMLPSLLFVFLGLLLFSGENLTENILTYIIIGYGFLSTKHAVTKV